MPLSLMRQDITHLRVDSVVNAANEGLRPGGGVCGAIFAAAGFDDLRQACEEIGHVDTGSAVATPAFALPARHIIHTAGPIWYGGKSGERDLLASCYRSSLELAWGLGDRSIAFPLISAGIYGYPPAEALAVAIGEIRAFLLEQPDMEVILCLFDRRATTLTQGLFGTIEHYIDDTYVETSPYARDRASGLWTDMDAQRVNTAIPEGYARNDGAPMAAPAAPAPKSHRRRKGAKWPFRKKERDVSEEALGSYTAGKPQDTATWAPVGTQVSLEQMLSQLDEPFSILLLSMIDERGLTDAQVYSRANLSRQYFSKLRSGKVNPSKRVVLSLAVALKLSLNETQALLERAGHALSHANKFDVIVEWFIKTGQYDVFEINEALFAFDQPLLGAS